MAAQLGSLLATFEQLWPRAGAESWDAPGLITGNPNQMVSRVLLTVDITAAVVAEAQQMQAQLVIAHHPYLLRGVTGLAEDTAKGSNIATAIRGDIAMFAAHTNADIVADGVSDTIAKMLRLTQVSALDNLASTVGHGRFGLLETPTSLGDFARELARILPSTATGIRVSGDYNQMISSVALCGGAGDSFIPAATSAGADVYVTSDLRHHPAQDAKEAALLGEAPALIDVSHWASEWLWLGVAAEQLRKIYPDIDFVVCDLRTDPWDFVITQ